MSDDEIREKELELELMKMKRARSSKSAPALQDIAPPVPADDPNLTPMGNVVRNVVQAAQVPRPAREEPPPRHEEPPAPKAPKNNASLLDRLMDNKDVFGAGGMLGILFGFGVGMLIGFVVKSVIG